MSGSNLFAFERGFRGTAPKHGPEGEAAELRADLLKWLPKLCAITVEEFTNPPAASAAGILAATASSVAVQSIGPSSMVGAPTTEFTLTYPRPITVTTAGVTPADAPATVTITGKDVDGNAMTEAISVPQTATVASGVKCFKSVSLITTTAGDGTGATMAIGWDAPIGLTLSPQPRAGATLMVREIAVGALVTTGAISAAGTNAPHGMYTPASAADGARDFAIFYELLAPTS